MHGKKWDANKDGDQPPAGPPESGMALSKGQRVPERALHRKNDQVPRPLTVWLPRVTDGDWLP